MYVYPFLFYGVGGENLFGVALQLSHLLTSCNNLCLYAYISYSTHYNCAAFEVIGYYRYKNRILPNLIFPLHLSEIKPAKQYIDVSLFITKTTPKNK